MNFKNTNSINVLNASPIVRFCAYILCFMCVCLSTQLMAQEELPSHEKQYNLHIGNSDQNTKEAGQNVITHVISEPNATWLRLFFKDINLGSKSTIKITSNTDGASQVLTSSSISSWKNSSAYFNGDSVTITLTIASGEKGIGLNVFELAVGDPSPQVRTQCGANDDRRGSNDAAIGRIVPIGCTGWIIRNGRLVTAGHCISSRAQIIEFNVPKSNPNRSIVHPGPEDQYPIGNFVTPYTNSPSQLNDWAVFTASANSITGRTPIQAQGKSFNVVRTNPGSNITITGYGTDTGRDNQTQQIHTGPLSSVDNSFVRYGTDTTGGNSGSPIIDTATGNAIGVHAYGGCSATGGSNFGERATIPAFWNAMGLGNGPAPSSRIVRMVKRNTTFALDGNRGGSNGQNVYLWRDRANNVNQQWQEINQGGGFYSYVKIGTNFAIDGRGGGSNGQNVYLWPYNQNNFNQHWRKVNVGGGFYRLEKRNAPGFSIDGNGGGRNGQNVHLWNSNNNNQNQHWRFITVNTRAENVGGITESVDNQDSDLKVSVFPNPIKDIFSIQVNNSINTNFKANIYSILGNKIATIKLNPGENSFSKTDFSLSSGVYIINIKDDTGASVKETKLIFE